MQEGVQQAAKPDHVGDDSSPDNVNSAESVALGNSRVCVDAVINSDQVCAAVVLSSNKRRGAVQQRVECWAVTAAQVFHQAGVLQSSFLPAARTRL